MELILPVGFALNSSTVAEPGGLDATAWNSATNYTLGTLVHRIATHRIYENAIAGTDSATPESFAGLDDDDPLKRWKEVHPTNRWAMFDQAVGTITVDASPMVVELTPDDFVDSLALLDVAASTVRIQQYDTDGVTLVYDLTVDMYDTNDVVDAWEYAFSPIVRKTQVIVTDLLPITAGKIKLTFTSDSTVGAGTCVPGNRRVFGDTQWSPKIGINNYSTKKVNAKTGVTAVDPGKFSKRISAQVVCPTGAVDALIETLEELRDTPVVWLGAKEMFRSLTVYGYYRDWEMDVAYSQQSYLSLSIEGLA